MKKSIATNQTHAALLDVATGLFNRRGFSNTKLKDIAERLHVTENALYHYVSSKQELIYQCYLETCNRRQNLLADPAFGGDSGLETVMSFVAASLSPEAESAAVMSEVPSLSPAQRERVSLESKRTLHMLAEMIRGGIDDGSIRPLDPVIAAFSIGSMLDWVPIWFSAKRHDKADVLACFTEIIGYGVATQKLNFNAADLPPYTTMAPANVPGAFDRDEMSARKREQILRTASELVSRQGLGGTTIDTIAQTLGLSKGAIYHYFKNRNELLYECFARSEQLGQHCRALALEATTDPLLRYCTFQYYYRLGHASADGPIPVMAHAAALPKTHNRRLMQSTARIQKFADDCFLTAIERGAMKPLNREYARHAMSGMTNWLAKWYSSDGRLDLDAIAGLQIDLWADGLASRG